MSHASCHLPACRCDECYNRADMLNVHGYTKEEPSTPSHEVSARVLVWGGK